MQEIELLPRQQHFRPDFSLLIRNELATIQQYFTSLRMIKSQINALCAQGALSDSTLPFICRLDDPHHFHRYKAIETANVIVTIHRNALLQPTEEMATECYQLNNISEVSVGHPCGNVYIRAADGYYLIYLSLISELRFHINHIPSAHA